MQASRHDHCSAVSKHVEQLYIYQIVYFLFLTSLLLPFICIFGLPGILICCTGVVPPPASGPRQEVCSAFSLLIFSFPFFCGMQMWIQLYVLTCEDQLYSLLNFNSKIYVLASCSIKKLHVLGCLVLHYPAAVAFSSHYWFCDHAKSRWEIRMTRLLPWVFCVIHDSYLNQIWS